MSGLAVPRFPLGPRLGAGCSSFGVGLSSRGGLFDQPLPQLAGTLKVLRKLLLALSASGLLNTPPNAGTFLRVAAGLGLAIATLTNLSKSETKRWKDSVS
mgnify:CR=1 FL=1